MQLKLQDSEIFKGRPQISNNVMFLTTWDTTQNCQHETCFWKFNGEKNTSESKITTVVPLSYIPVSSLKLVGYNAFEVQKHQDC